MCEFVHFVCCKAFLSNVFPSLPFSHYVTLSIYTHTYTKDNKTTRASHCFILTIKSDKRKNKIRTQWLHGITLHDKMTEHERAEKGMNKRPHNIWQAHASIC